MSIFDIDYDLLVWQLLPVRLRKAAHFAWLKLLATPVKWIHGLFKENRDKNLYMLAHNSQVVYMEQALNDTFDGINRGIYIVDGPFKDPLFTYLDPESKPIWLGLVSEAGTTTYTDPLVLYTTSETVLLGIGFVVKVPATVSFDPDRMKAMINLYRLSGRSRYDVALY